MCRSHCLIARSVVTALALAGTLAVWPAIPTLVRADSTQPGGITIEHPWARPTDAMAKTGAVYFVLKNAGPEADRLVSVSTPVAESAQLHQDVNKDGMIHMESLSAIEIPAGSSVAIKPGVFHVMLMNPKRQLKPGQRIEVTLTFAKAGPVTIRVPVGQPGGMGDMPMDHSGMGHGHGDMKDDMGGMKH